MIQSTCEVEGCNNPAQLIMKNHSYCIAHQDLANNPDSNIVVSGNTVSDDWFTIKDSEE